MLDSGGHGLLGEPRHLDQREVEMDGVAAAVRSLQQRRAPDHHESHSGRKGGGVPAVDGRGADVIAHAPGVVPGEDPRFRVDGDASAVDFRPSRSHARLVVADQVGHDPELVPHVRPLLESGWNDGVESEIEGDGLDVVRFQRETHPLHRFEHLVTDRAHRSVLRVRGQGPGATHGHLLGPPARRGIAVEHVAVGVPAHPEPELETSVVGRGHGTDLLRPGGIAGAHDGERVGDLVVESFVGSRQRPDRIVGHGSPAPLVECPVRGRTDDATVPGVMSG